MKRQDLEKLSNDELLNRAREIQDELFQARLKFRMGQFKKTSEFSRLRKDIARVKTLVRERELVEARKGAEK